MITLKPIKIGNVEIGFPVIQAALSGYSDWAQRRIVRMLGASATISEVMLDQFIVSVTEGKGKKARRFLRVDEEDHPVGAQLMGSDPEQFLSAAKRLVHWGFNWIDLNFGCPVKKVLGRRRGGYLLGEPEKALEIVARVRDAIPPDIPLTVKMRRGIDDSPKSRDQFFQIFFGAVQLGVDAFTVHPRTVQQKYIGPSNWDFLAELKRSAPNVTILGSGDLFSAEDILRMIHTTGVDGVTVARGGIGNPWIFQDVRMLAAGKPVLRPTLCEQASIIRQHFLLATELYAEPRAVFHMKKFCIKYAQLHPQHETLRDAFISVKCQKDWESVLDKWYLNSEQVL